MPRGPQGEERPADVIGNAVEVMRIASGEEPEDYGRKLEKNQAAAEQVLSPCGSGIRGVNARIHGSRDACCR